MFLCLRAVMQNSAQQELHVTPCVEEDAVLSHLFLGTTTCFIFRLIRYKLDCGYKEKTHVHTQIHTLVSHPLGSAHVTLQKFLDGQSEAFKRRSFHGDGTVTAADGFC